MLNEDGYAEGKDPERVDYGLLNLSFVRRLCESMSWIWENRISKLQTVVVAAFSMVANPWHIDGEAVTVLLLKVRQSPCAIC